MKIFLSTLLITALLLGFIIPVEAQSDNSDKKVASAVLLHPPGCLSQQGFGSVMEFRSFHAGFYAQLSMSVANVKSPLLHFKNVDGEIIETVDVTGLDLHQINELVAGKGLKRSKNSVHASLGKPYYGPLPGIFCLSHYRDIVAMNKITSPKLKKKKNKDDKNKEQSNNDEKNIDIVENQTVAEIQEKDRTAASPKRKASLHEAFMRIPSAKNLRGSNLRLQKNISLSRLIIKNPIALYCIVNMESNENIGNELASIFNGKEESIRLCLFCILKEMTSINGEISLLLRGGGTIVRCLCKSIQLAGENYLNEVVKEILTKFISPSKNYEIDPEHLQAGDSLENNLVNVKEAVLVILAYVRSSIPRLPPMIVVLICQFHSLVKRDHRGFEWLPVISLFILRFLMPALAMPDSIEKDLPPEVKKAATTIGKVLQFIYNQTDAKDPLLEPLSDFISYHHTSALDLVQAFLDVEEDLSPSKIIKTFKKTEGNNRKKSKAGLEAFLDNYLDNFIDLFVKVVSGKEESGISQLYQVINLENQIFPNQAHQLSRKFWVEHLANWIAHRLETANLPQPESFTIILDVISSCEPGKLYKDYTICEFVVKEPNSAEFIRIKLERDLAKYDKVMKLITIACNNKFATNNFTISYMKDGKQKPLQRGNWKEFKSAPPIVKQITKNIGIYELTINLVDQPVVLPSVNE